VIELRSDAQGPAKGQSSEFKLLHKLSSSIAGITSDHKQQAAETGSVCSMKSQKVAEKQLVNPVCRLESR